MTHNPTLITRESRTPMPCTGPYNKQKMATIIAAGAAFTICYMTAAEVTDYKTTHHVQHDPSKKGWIHGGAALVGGAAYGKLIEVLGEGNLETTNCCGLQLRTKVIVGSGTACAGAFGGLFTLVALANGDDPSNTAGIVAGVGFVAGAIIGTFIAIIAKGVANLLCCSCFVNEEEIERITPNAGAGPYGSLSGSLNQEEGPA